MVFTKSIANFFNLTLSPSSLKHGYSKHIEQYRGLCALLVFIEHAALYPDWLGCKFRWPKYFNYFGAGHLSVIIFFCISGYVIGLNYDNSSLDIKDYIKRRLVRLYPIYIIAIMGMAILTNGHGLWVIIGNLLFLQNSAPYVHFSVPVILGVTWSLNFEVMYYLLFIGLFFLKPKTWKLLSVMLFFSFLLRNADGSIVIFARYLNGSYIWLLGLMLAWGLFKFGVSKNNFVPLLSMLFLQLCYQHLDIGLIIVHILKLNTSPAIDYIFDIPFCLMIMSILTSKDSAFLRFNKIVCYALPALVFIPLILSNRLFEDLRWIICIIYWLLSLILYYEKRLSAFLLQKLTGMGKISYAFYLVHAPIALLIKKTIFIDNQNVEVAAKYLLWIGLTYTLSILLEIYLQPLIKKYFFRKPSQLPTPKPVN